MKCREYDLTGALSFWESFETIAHEVHFLVIQRKKVLVIKIRSCPHKVVKMIPEK